MLLKMSHIHLLAHTGSFFFFLHSVKQSIFVQNRTSGRNLQKECGGTSVNINLLPINRLQLLHSLRLSSTLRLSCGYYANRDRVNEPFSSCCKSLKGHLYPDGLLPVVFYMYIYSVLVYMSRIAKAVLERVA